MSLTLRSRLLLLLLLVSMVVLLPALVGLRWVMAEPGYRVIAWQLVIGALLIALGVAGAIGLARGVELQLALALERSRLAEQQASQGQRLQVLGRLTGDVAHDINNLLGVVSNSMHLIERHPAAAELHKPLAATQRAVDSGSQLTQLLLRLARQQPMQAQAQTQALALGQFMVDVQTLMRSLLGRRIEVSVQVDGSTAPVRVDGAELELALLHLALDARDAMPGGGELRLRAGNASAEDRAGLAGHPARAYVVITVGDDGVGHGAAAGLSHAHAVCSQAGGTARLDSTPGVGSTVSLLLPAWRGDDVAAGRSGDHR